MLQDPVKARMRFGIQFSVLARQWRRVIEKELERAGLTDATWAPLLHLDEAGDGLTQKQLAARVGIDGSSLVRLLDILASRHLIERQIDETDRRARQIFLTAQGRVAVDEVRAILASVETSILDQVSREELEATTTALRKIRGRLDQIEDGSRLP